MLMANAAQYVKEPTSVLWAMNVMQMPRAKIWTQDMPAYANRDLTV